MQATKRKNVLEGKMGYAALATLCCSAPAAAVEIPAGDWKLTANYDGSPNLQQGATLLNTAPGTTAMDMRQVFMTFGNDRIGTFPLGRNTGLFGADVILNDMTLPGVGASNGNYAAPANTSLGSIGLAYLSF